MSDRRQHTLAAGTLVAVLALAAGGALPKGKAEAAHQHSGATPPAGVPAGSQETDEPSEAGATMAMSDGSLMSNAHMMFTPMRGRSVADSAQAAKVVDSLRRSIEKYRDVHVAEQAGYQLFAPGAEQKVYHFTNRWLAVKEAFRFDPGQPGSLLYERDATGDYHLVGAMYHMPANATMEQLDRRVPLSIGQWHQHVDLCVPPRGETRRWQETRDGLPVFGPASPISTQGDCARVGGRFFPQIFGWMVHVHPFEADPGKVWGDEHTMPPMSQPGH